MFYVEYQSSSSSNYNNNNRSKMSNFGNIRMNQIYVEAVQEMHLLETNHTNL